MSAPQSLFAGLLCFVFAVAPFQCPSDPDPDKRREETPGEALYDLASDPAESVDVSEAHAEIATELRAEWDAYAARVGIVLT